MRNMPLGSYVQQADSGTTPAALIRVHSCPFVALNLFPPARIYYLDVKVTTMTTTKTSRGIFEKIPAMETLEGAGVRINRAFPTRSFDYLDPFLLLDEMGPFQFSAGQNAGFPDHPHRGFETVTYLLDGQMEHRDSFGHHGRLNPGDVQWMTAGSGLVHSEMPGADMVKNGGLLHGFQLWVNLPKARQDDRAGVSGTEGR